MKPAVVPLVLEGEFIFGDAELGIGGAGGRRELGDRALGGGAGLPIRPAGRWTATLRASSQSQELGGECMRLLSSKVKATSGWAPAWVVVEAGWALKPTIGTEAWAAAGRSKPMRRKRQRTARLAGAVDHFAPPRSPAGVHDGPSWCFLPVPFLVLFAVMLGHTCLTLPPLRRPRWPGRGEAELRCRAHGTLRRRHRAGGWRLGKPPLVRAS